MQPKEITICGLAAVRAQFATDAAAIKRLFFDLPTSRRLAAMSRAMAQARKVYRCLPDEELAKIAGTIHHGGVVAVVTAPALRAPSGSEPSNWVQKRQALLVLDRIGNAHNLGAIARTAAFFGVPRLVLAGDAASARPGEAAHRVAEGGLAHVEVLSVPDLAAFLQQLRAAGYDVVGAATRGGRPQMRVRAAAPLALVLGNEEHGLAAEVVAACSRLVTLPGSGKVESLNVSVAAGILLWELHART